MGAWIKGRISSTVVDLKVQLNPRWHYLGEGVQWGRSFVVVHPIPNDIVEHALALDGAPLEVLCARLAHFPFLRSDHNVEALPRPLAVRLVEYLLGLEQAAHGAGEIGATEAGPSRRLLPCK
jgi:hypothetical protein